MASTHSKFVSLSISIYPNLSGSGLLNLRWSSARDIDLTPVRHIAWSVFVPKILISVGKSAVEFLAKFVPLGIRI